MRIYKHFIRPVVMLIITIGVPILLILTSIRLLFLPFWMEYEYRSPNFPIDTYGFSTEDRIKWGEYSLSYLENNSSLDYLKVTLPDGTQLFNSRELSHMLDVKRLFQSVMTVWIAMLVVLIAIGYFIRHTFLATDFWTAIARGGWLSIGLVVAALIFVAINFYQLFTDFHELFFTGDTWLFDYSDHLIRLFPLQFWQDAFIWLGGITLVGGLIFGLLGRRLSKG